MENPLELPVPNTTIEQIHALAKDLAFGAINRDWDSKIVLDEKEDWVNGLNLPPTDKQTRNQQLLLEKWNHKPLLPLSLLVSFQYIEKQGERGTKGTVIQHEQDYVLTSKSFELLEKPAKPVKIFVSYQRDKSSALALLIEARLKLADAEIKVFIDKDLEFGGKWHGELESKVRECKYFICLLTPTSLNSEWVRNEIKWALEESKQDNLEIIPICHHRYKFTVGEANKDKDQIKPILEQLGSYHSIEINRETAEEYEIKISKLLNRLGYSTY